MKRACAVVCSVLLLVCECQGLGYKFPKWFKFGAASSAYQIEGAWNVSDKGESIWDYLTLSQPYLVRDGSNGCEACDSYHLWRRDIEMAAELGLNMYRFSISWPRLLPSGFPNSISEDGKQYYNNLIDGLLEKGIEPIVTLYHFDLPQSLQDLGGWANPLIVEWFTDYADVVFSLYGDRVKTWVTLNEPLSICDAGYTQLAAPYIDDPMVGRYLCNKNTLIAHAKAYRLYQEVYRPKYSELKAKLSLATLFHWFEPATPDDVELTELSLEYWEGRFAHPVFSKKGGWPRKLEIYLNKKAKKEGFLYPRLPPFSPEEIDLVRGTYDYYGLNHYTTRQIRKLKKREKAGLWPFYSSDELKMKMVSHRSWGTSDIDWFAIYPEGLRKQMNWLKARYNVKEIIILECGLMTLDKGLADSTRVEYFRHYLEQVLLAINDGVPVTGFTAWTMMDNFEWLGGYSVLLVVSECEGVVYKFPEWFKFGVASAAYQVEGGWNASDKGESIWDYLVHSRPELIAGRVTGDVACDSYHLWRRDIEVAEELGLNMYRISISWSHLLPSGFPNIISEDGKRYYNDLIDGLLKKGIEPVVTLHHFDLPQSLQDLGGWANPLSSDWFADYAEVVFSLYADRVKTWLTLNELIGVCDNGYFLSAAPYIDDPEIGRYLCNKYTLIAHAKAYRIYDEIYRPRYNGKVSLTNIFLWFEPATPDDVELAELALEFWEGRYSHPIFSKEGGWPIKLEKFLLENGKKEGYPYPRLPPFTAEEIELVRGTYDFYALNHYTTRLIRKLRPGEKPGKWPLFGSKELNMNMESHPSWKTSDLPWLSIYPEGLRSQLQWLHATYDVKEIMILENGLATFDSGLNDTIRLEYIRDHLEQILLAINDGIPVTGYTAWTLMDNFEWFGGYSAKFGLYAVDFNDPNRTRTPRESALFYANVAKSRTLHTTNKQYQPL